MRFANDFHSWLRHSWKLLANRLTRDPKIVIHGNSCIILYIFVWYVEKHIDVNFWKMQPCCNYPPCTDRLLPACRQSGGSVPCVGNSCSLDTNIDTFVTSICVINPMCAPCVISDLVRPPTCADIYWVTAPWLGNRAICLASELSGSWCTVQGPDSI